MNARTLLRVTAALEVVTALGLLLLPGLMLLLLFADTPRTAFSLLLARLFGAPLLSLGLMCWATSQEPGGRVVARHLAAMLVYNVVVAALLVYSGAILQLAGIALWPAVVAHVVLAVWCAVEVRKGGRAAWSDIASR